ncbi:MAG: hypothetical protein CME69_02115 [Halobacteriovorax sp.]|nr:hypothetical protein [Halobacteriovorax sp.]
MKIFILTIFISLSTFAGEKTEVVKEKFYDLFYVKRLALARKSISSQIKKYNQENKKSRFLENDSGYIMRKDPYEIRFSFVDIIFKKIFINNQEFELVRDESQNSLKERLRKFLNKKTRRQTFINFLYTDAYAVSEEAFDLILKAVMSLTGFDDPFWDNSFKDQAQNIVKEILKQRDQCLVFKENNQGGIPSSSSSLGRFIDKVLLTSAENDIKEFKSRVSEIIVEDSDVANSRKEDIKNAVSGMRGCASLGYLIGEEVLDLDGNLLNQVGFNLNSISYYSGKKIDTSVNYMANVCQAFEELASCIADIEIYDLSENSFKRTKKQLREAASDSDVKIYKETKSR